MSLESSEGVDGEKTEGGRADDAAERDGAEAVAGIVGVFADAVVAGDEEFSRRDDDVDGAVSGFFGSIGR